MTEPQALRLTAILIFIPVVIVAALSALWTLMYTLGNYSAPFGYLAIGLSVLLPFGLLAHLLYRHISTGANIVSDVGGFIISIAMILVCAPIFQSLAGSMAGSRSFVNLFFLVPGILGFIWTAWSYSLRIRG